MASATTQLLSYALIARCEQVGRDAPDDPICAELSHRMLENACGIASMEGDVLAGLPGQQPPTPLAGPVAAPVDKDERFAQLREQLRASRGGDNLPNGLRELP